MAEFDLVVRNAKIVNEDRQIEGDIAVKDGVIAAIGPDIKGKGLVLDDKECVFAPSTDQIPPPGWTAWEVVPTQCQLAVAVNETDRPRILARRIW